MRSIRAAVLCLAAVLFAGPPPAQAQTRPRRVLLLYSYEREFSHFTFARMFRPELTRRSPDAIEFVEISLQNVRATRPISDQAVIDDLRGTLGSRPLDLVVSIGGPAASFAQTYKQVMFPSTPLLLAATDARFIRNDRLTADETAVSVLNDPARMLQSMLDLIPDLKTVVVVVGASQPEQFWLHEVQEEFRRFEARLQFIWTNRLSMAALLERCRTLPPHSAIFYGVLSLDGDGVPQMEDQALDAIHAAANAPMFGLHSHQLGHGIVGGPLISMEDVSRESAAAALRLLHRQGDAPLPPRTLFAGTPVFDSRELRRWDIPESRLQAASVIRYREPPLWRRHKGIAAVIVAFVGAQTLLVVGLAINAARRRRTAEADVRNAEAAVARLAHRLLQAHEDERAAFSATVHEDISQQLTGLKMRLQALALEGTDARLRSRMEDLSDQMSMIERRVLALPDPMYARLEMLGLVASARALAQRACLTHGIKLTFVARDVPFKLADNITVALFRVLQEAIDNVVQHAVTPALAVSLAAAHGMIELDVTDDGKGFDPAEAIAAGAVGLVAMRERVRAVGGSCTFHSRPGSGTAVRARVPVQ
jgi:signal transduction histidine kinase